jgi:hypothetical protein
MTVASILKRPRDIFHFTPDLLQRETDKDAEKQTPRWCALLHGLSIHLEMAEPFCYFIAAINDERK